MLLDAAPIQVPLANPGFYIAVGPACRVLNDPSHSIGYRTPKTLSNQSALRLPMPRLRNLQIRVCGCHLLS